MLFGANVSSDATIQAGATHNPHLPKNGDRLVAVVGKRRRANRAGCFVDRLGSSFVFAIRRANLVGKQGKCRLLACIRGIINSVWIDER
ncbi:hypothetical protein HMPREF0476_1764 [Kingella kingae ATCC 23330]|uniref:Uncharacterized protein n=1 Tax=Kingella kingae ATCC 23330 TaxID=887327 RepID=F5S981_KINKI|nr:hypothetical protein HMPREF0476_1764 [Kingella kingae ATCC 23330]